MRCVWESTKPGRTTRWPTSIRSAEAASGRASIFARVPMAAILPPRTNSAPSLRIPRLASARPRRGPRPRRVKSCDAPVMSREVDKSRLLCRNADGRAQCEGRAGAPFRLADCGVLHGPQTELQTRATVERLLTDLKPLRPVLYMPGRTWFLQSLRKKSVSCFLATGLKRAHVAVIQRVGHFAKQGGHVLGHAQLHQCLNRLDRRATAHR